MKIDGPVGAHPLCVRVEQVADGQTNELKFNRQLVVLPAVDVRSMMMTGRPQGGM
jgi:hypothetical protein